MDTPSFLFQFACLILLFGGTGCGSARYQINIGNGDPNEIVREIEVLADGDRLSIFQQIGPAKIAASQPSGGTLPSTLQVRWVDAEGVRHTQDIQIADQVDQEFRGQLIVEITSDNTLTLSLVEAVKDTFDPLPWTLPEIWEGSVMMPGMAP